MLLLKFSAFCCWFPPHFLKGQLMVHCGSFREPGHSAPMSWPAAEQAVGSFSIEG